MGESLFQCGSLLDRQIGMEPLVIDWAKEKVKMAKIFHKIHVYLLITLFLSRLCHNFCSQVNSTEGVLPNHEF